MSIPVSASDEFNIVLTGAHLAAIIAGLGELPHKIADPLEAHLASEVQRALAAKAIPVPVATDTI